MTATNPERISNIIEQDLAEEVLLYSVAGEVVHILNLPAYHIWRRCDGRHTVADIARDLRQTFDLPPDHDLLQDIHDTVEALTQKGLLARR